VSVPAVPGKAVRVAAAAIMSSVFRIVDNQT
jgi:hypothetical protein